jgi:hypothetical protein
MHAKADVVASIFREQVQSPVQNEGGDTTIRAISLNTEDSHFIRLHPRRIASLRDVDVFVFYSPVEPRMNRLVHALLLQAFGLWQHYSHLEEKGRLHIFRSKYTITFIGSTFMAY